jgi:cytochrome P450
MTSYETAGWFTDLSLVDDPFPYYEHLRAKGPVVREPRHGVVVVTGYQEALAVYRDDEHFSSINAPSGPIPPLPFTPDPYDIGPQIQQYRDQIIYSEPTYLLRGMQELHLDIRSRTDVIPSPRAA